jgi:hypothetical protein
MVYQLSFIGWPAFLRMARQTIVFEQINISPPTLCFQQSLRRDSFHVLASLKAKAGGRTWT